MFYSIKPKADVGLFDDICVFTSSYLFLAENWFEDQSKTIFGSKQVKTGKNR